MQCQEARQLLSAYMDGQLEVLQMEDMTAHLEECSACGAELAEIQQAISFLHQLPELTPPPEFRTRLKEQIGAGDLDSGPSRAPRNFFPHRWVRFVAAAAVICLAVGITTLLYGLPSQWGGQDLAKNSLQEDMVSKDTVSQDIAAKEQQPGDIDLMHKSVGNMPEVPESGNESGRLETFRAGDSVGSTEEESGQVEITPPENEKVPADSPGVTEPRDGMGGGPPAGGDDPQVSIMAVPREGDDRDKSFTKQNNSPPGGINGAPEGAAELPAGLPEPEKEVLTIQIEDLNQALNEVNEIVERYSGKVISRQEKTVRLQFSAAIIDKAVTEIKSVGEVLESTESSLGVKYREFNNNLQVLLEEKNMLSRKENITPEEKERLQYIQNRINEYNQQLRDLDTSVTVNFQSI